MATIGSLLAVGVSTRTRLSRRRCGGNSQSAPRTCARMHTMDWDDLRVFLAIYRAGSTSAAARALGVQHTTVGRRLTSLEDALGTSLFTRTPTGLVPTADAEALVRDAEAAERSMRAVE